MTFDLAKVFHSMGPFALAVAGALVLLAIAGLAVFLERLWTLGRSRGRSRRFADEASALLERGEHRQLVAAADRRAESHLAALLGAGMKTYLGAASRPSPNLPPVELARRELGRRADAIAAELRRGMGVLASVGSVAPFVGLLGTVVGIISAFEGIAKEGSGGLGAVSSGIAEALVVTALGLFVAIPAVLGFNYLTARIDAFLLVLDQARGELVDYLESGRIEAMHLREDVAAAEEAVALVGGARAVDEGGADAGAA